mmetsp:Transcript_138111/g.441269  ORF Transcript_138111/g.441269 Transcript_138111/m.441269 type:complete len:218 (+) Transcript_138111:191-844(+)
MTASSSGSSILSRLPVKIALACGFGALLLGCLYMVLSWYLKQQRKAARLEKKKRRESSEEPAGDGTRETRSASVGAADSEPRRRKQAAEQDVVRARASAPVARPPPQWAPAAPLNRGSDVIAKEAELKRDALHVFRRLQASASAEEKSALCKEAVAVYDSIERRVGGGMAPITSGRIVFCNALMECGGLDELRDCQDSKDPHASALVERVVPIIFST